VIEFARSIDNITGYYNELSKITKGDSSPYSNRLNYYFDTFLQDIKHVTHHEYLTNMQAYNEYIKTNKELGESLFFSEIKTQYPEFESIFDRSRTHEIKKPNDLMEYILYNSPFLNREENKWMQSVIRVVRDTSLYFEPQRRTQILNEGWASFWHERLFLADKRIKGHEVDFARVHAKVTSLQRVGLNPYAIGMRLIEYLENAAEKGLHSYEYEKTQDIEMRLKYNRKNKNASDFLFTMREENCDFTLINTYLNQDFVNRYKLFTVEKKLTEERQSWQFVVKSRKCEDYKAMVIETLWHPPHIVVEEEKTDESRIYLNHIDEGKPLVNEYIQNTLIGIEYFWGGEVNLETSHIFYVPDKESGKKIVKERKLYTMKDHKTYVRGL
jgi:stage V sporulation protein R